MRQIGMAMQMYVNDWKGTYPPCWIQDDKAVTPPNSYVGEVGKNRSYVTLLLKYVGFPKNDPYQGCNAKLFTCPNDLLERASWLGRGRIVIHNAIKLGTRRYLLQAALQRISKPTFLRHDAEPGYWTILEWPQFLSDVGSNFDDQAGPKVLLLVERSYSEQAKTVVWNLGYSISRPADQMYSAGGAYGFPLLHGGKGREGQARFNYLYVDNHVEQQTGEKPSTINRPQLTTPVPGEGGDYSWTIQPDKFHQ